ncbi:MAG: transposase [Bdellovibrionales bacterium]|nr:transposase [Bdellovibrionales bacterium]
MAIPSHKYIAPIMKQQSLFNKETKSRYGRTEYGGLKTKGHRKLERPFHQRKWMHLVLKSDKAYGKLSLKGANNQNFIRQLVYDKAKQFGVSIGDFVNMGNHLHIKARSSSRLQFQKFLKSITGRIARYVTGARRGRKFGRFWQGLAYTRVLASSLEERRLHNYFCANRMEDLAGKKRREKYLNEMNEYLKQQRKRAKSDQRSYSFEETAPAWA